ncbi:MAG: hypothetical protein JWP36_846 [Paucimonas sp.]|nr:hypothetical protein [Paucimonas sp.]
MQKVSEVMTRDVRCITPHETVRRAAQMMDELNVGALPVCESDRLVGMVTDRDITVRATAAGLGPDSTRVEDVMSSNVRSCYEDEALDEVMITMADSQIRRIPVVSHDDQHRLLGIIALGDLAARAAKDAQQKVDVEETLESVSYPAQPDIPSSASASGNTPGGSAGSGLPSAG